LRPTTKPYSVANSSGCRAQHSNPLADNKKTVVKLNDVPLEDSAYSALRKSMNYAVAPAVLPIDDILSGVE
jgi:hypothetical protein